MTDKEILSRLGTANNIATALNISLDAARKFNTRGIPWKYRSAVQRLAKVKKIKLPDDFLENQRVA